MEIACHAPPPRPLPSTSPASCGRGRVRSLAVGRLLGASLATALPLLKARPKAARRAKGKLQWPEEPAPVLTSQQESYITQVILQKFNFRRLTSEEAKDFRRSICECDGLEDASDFSEDLLRDLRRSVQIQAALRFTHRCTSCKKQILEKREASEASNSLALPRLSKGLWVPPIALLKVMQQPQDLPEGTKLFSVFRRLERENFKSQEDVQKMFSNVKPWFLRELLWAFENDLEALQQITEDSASAFEDSVAEYCGTAGVAIQREDELRSADSLGGLTPDVLFEAPVTFESSGDSEQQDFRWLECKNFHAGAQNAMVLRGLKKQAQKYVKALGPGAVVFAGGASQKVRQTLEQLGVGTLDGSNLRSIGRPKGLKPSYAAGPKADFWKIPHEKIFGSKSSGGSRGKKQPVKSAQKTAVDAKVKRKKATKTESKMKAAEHVPSTTKKEAQKPAEKISKPGRRRPPPVPPPKD